jgi:hypothetical protein
MVGKLWDWQFFFLFFLRNLNTPLLLVIIFFFIFFYFSLTKLTIQPTSDNVKTFERKPSSSSKNEICGREEENIQLFHYAMDFNGVVAVVNNFFYLQNFLLAQHIIYSRASFYKYALLYVLTSVRKLNKFFCVFSIFLHSWASSSKLFFFLLSYIFIAQMSIDFHKWWKLN